MKEETFLPGQESSHSNGLLLQLLAENEHKIALLNQAQALKAAELTRLQQELEELNKLYPGNNRK